MNCSSQQQTQLYWLHIHNISMGREKQHRIDICFSKPNQSATRETCHQPTGDCQTKKPLNILL